MKKYKFLLILIGTLSTILFGQDKSNWETIDKRPIPSWFSDAKFGIFIHWGPYSVPAWSPKGAHAEWYQYWLENKIVQGTDKYSGDEVVRYHNKIYGPHFSYYQFAEQFAADLFKPDEWTNLFQKAGAKYIVLTSKHHDGFCLWPSQEANDRGFLWNSVEVGPKRDIVGELKKSIEKSDIKFGLYYSFCEWYHPWWLSDQKKYVQEHFHPQFKDLIESYKPDLIWTDGEEEFTSEDWKSQELLTWLFNESPVKNDIVINDGWGTETGQKHGGFVSTDSRTSENLNKPWEKCRGIGTSFGYNRNENIEDYASAHELILILADIVSNGGNLLLSIGPEASGKIPLIIQERLLQMGKWLNINGEAIYGTKPWKTSCQSGKKDVFFTKKGPDIYGICPLYPKDELVINDLELPDSGSVEFLATRQSLGWQNINGNLHIKMPEFDPEILSNELTYAYVFKLINADKVPQIIKTAPESQDSTTTITEIEQTIEQDIDEPVIAVSYANINSQPIISIKNHKDHKTYYTLDGSLPDTSSSLYTVPFSINKSARMKVMIKNYLENRDYFLEKYIKVIDEFVNFKLVYPPHKSFSGDGTITLCDGIYGNTDHKSGNWLGFHGKDLIAEIELSSERFINSVTVSALHNQSENILFPTEFEIYTSLDNENFEYVKKLEIAKPEKELSQKKFILEIPMQKAKSIRVFIKNWGQLPDSSDGQPQLAWLFVDEIEVR